MVPVAVIALLALVVLLAAALGLAVRRIIRLRRQVADLTDIGLHDMLTGLPNRRGLARGWAAMEGAKALLLIDLVGFKSVNDKFGHVLGDQLLQLASARLREIIHPAGLLARWGGDEFAAIVPAARLDIQCREIVDAPCIPFPLVDHDGVAHDIYIGARFGTASGTDRLDDAVRRAATELMTARMKSYKGYEKTPAFDEHGRPPGDARFRRGSAA